MKKKKVSLKMMVLALITVVLALIYPSSTASAWEDITGNIGSESVFTCLEGRDGGDFLYVGTQNGLFSTSDHGRTWKREKLSGGKVNVTGVAAVGESVFMSSKEGLFVNTPSGRVKPSRRVWERIPGKKDLKGVVSRDDERKIITWTDSEMLAVSNENWERIGPTGALGKIEDVVVSSGVVYAARDGYLFYSADGGKEWNSFFVASDTGNDVVSEDIVEEIEEGPRSAVRDLSAAYPSGVLIATDRGILVFDPGTGRAETIDTSGLPASSVNKVAGSEKGIFVSAGNKVFFKEAGGEGWMAVFEFAGEGGVVDIKVRNGGRGKEEDGRGEEEIIVLTAKKIYSASLSGVREHSDMDISAQKFFILQEGPGITEVQEMAIEYAEVSPEKIKGWRDAARWKAILPRFSLSYSEDYNDNVEIYKAANSSYVVNGPREKCNDWGMDMTWDLSDLIWNESQTSIDVRSKLMVQLRDDILEDVTRLYFERKKLINEMSAIKNRDDQKIQSKFLRIEELTAYIDAYTGGEFSRALGGEK